MTPMAKRIQVWFPEELQRKIILRVPTERTSEKQGGLSEAIRESLDRYYTLIDQARLGLQNRFAEPELGVIIDISNGTIFEAHSLQGILFNAQDCAPDGTWEKWGADEKTLLTKLEGLTLTEHAALVDACERWWRATSMGYQPEIGQLLKLEPTTKPEAKK
jgi:hypothetical protein